MEESMIHKTLLSIALLLLVLIFPASASMVSFLVVETGLNTETAITQHSSLWEGGLMDVFFEAGHIVTNYPVERMEKKPAQDLSGIIRADFYEAAEGGAEYFILAFLEYQNIETTVIPIGITLKLYKTNPQELIFEQTLPAGTGKTLNEEYQFAINAGRIIVSKIREE